MKVLILGAAGQIARMVETNLWDQTDAELVLYGRNVSTRLASLKSERVSLIDGDYAELDKLKLALTDVDFVYLNTVPRDVKFMTELVKLIEANSRARFISANIPDLYQEVSGPFTKWYRQMTGDNIWEGPRRQAADVIEASQIDYIILRITWLYNQPGNTKLHVSKKGEPLVESQVTRQAVAQFVTDVVTGKADYHRANLGLGEPDTAWEQPSFY